MWQAKPVKGKDSVGVTLTYLSKDGEMGFPGNLKTEVTYSLNDNNELHIDYTATTDKPTVLNLTNLSGTTASGSGGLTLNLSAQDLPVDGGIALRAGTQTAQSGTVVFSNANGVTFGMSGSSRVTASHDGLTTAALSNHSHALSFGVTGASVSTSAEA